MAGGQENDEGESGECGSCHAAILAILWHHRAMPEIGQPLNFATLRDLSHGGVVLGISAESYAAIDRGAAAVADIVRRGQPAYGVNTGFGRLAQTHIPNDQLELL